MLLPVLFVLFFSLGAALAQQQELSQPPVEPAATAVEASAADNEDNGPAVEDLINAADKRVPHPSAWRQPGRIRSFHAMEMPDFGRNGGRAGGPYRSRFYDYPAARPLFIRYMRNFGAPQNNLMQHLYSRRR